MQTPGTLAKKDLDGSLQIWGNQKRKPTARATGAATGPVRPDGVGAYLQTLPVFAGATAPRLGWCHKASGAPRNLVSTSFTPSGAHSLFIAGLKFMRTGPPTPG